MTMTKNPPKTDVKSKQSFHLDKDAIRAAAKKIDESDGPTLWTSRPRFVLSAWILQLWTWECRLTA